MSKNRGRRSGATDMDNSSHVLRTQMHTTNHTQAAAVRAAVEALGSAADMVHSEHSVRPAAARMQPSIVTGSSRGPL